MSRPKFSKTRIALVATLENVFSKKIDKLQSKFFRFVLDHYQSNLNVNNNKLKTSIKNLSVATDLNALEDTFFRKETSKVIKWMAHRLVDINGVNELYFRSNSADYTRQIMDKVERNMLSAYGIKVSTNKLTIKRGGWLHSVARFKDPYTRVKQVALSAVRLGMDINDFKKVIRENVINTKAASIKHHFNTHATDTFSQYNRQASKQYADKLGMKYFMYNGGIIDTTRFFCEERDGKVFTASEIDKWHLLINKKEGPQWSGGIYNPYDHVGGHNCRHDLDPISNRLAYRLRPELKPKNGKEVKK